LSLAFPYDGHFFFIFSCLSMGKINLRPYMPFFLLVTGVNKVRSLGALCVDVTPVSHSLTRAGQVASIHPHFSSLGTLLASCHCLWPLALRDYIRILHKAEVGGGTSLTNRSEFSCVSKITFFLLPWRPRNWIHSN
jgi:hypothetical protein